MAQRVNIDSCSPQQLYQLKQGFQGQINTLGQSMNQLRFALEKYEEGKRSIKAVQECQTDQQLLMPLSNSLYIMGTLQNQQKNQKTYTIEYGAGFFVERNAKEATDFYNRKIALVREKLGKLQEVIGEKREGLRAIEMRMMALVQQQQQQSGQKK